MAGAALGAGKHVWNEKPITADLASGEALVAQADAAGLLLGCAPDTFLGPGLQTVRRLIEAGAIGTPLTASVVMQYAGPHRWHPNPDFLYQAGAGPLFDMGPYYLTALSQTFGAVTRVAARGATAGPTRIIGTGRAPARRSRSPCRPTSRRSTTSRTAASRRRRSASTRR